jgi:hypothetical protein
MLTSSDVSLDYLISFAKKWNDLGWSVQEQVKDVIDGDYEDLNSNAIRLALKELGGMHKELKEMFTDWLNKYDKECSEEEEA